MKRHLTYLALCFLIVISSTASSSDLQIESLTRGLNELDLFSPETGAFVKEIQATQLHFPIPIVEDLGGEFLIFWDEQPFKVGSSSVITNQVLQMEIDATASCNTTLVRNPSASTRGLVNKGCQQ